MKIHSVVMLFSVTKNIRKRKNCGCLNYFGQMTAVSQRKEEPRFVQISVLKVNNKTNKQENSFLQQQGPLVPARSVGPVLKFQAPAPGI